MRDVIYSVLKRLHKSFLIVEVICEYKTVLFLEILRFSYTAYLITLVTVMAYLFLTAYV